MTTEKEVVTKAVVRPKRKPVGTRERLRIINQDPARQYRLINAEPDRIAVFEEAGYRIEEVKKHILGGQRTDVPTPSDNTIAVGGGQKQVLVSIEREFYEEDQSEKQRQVDEKEAGIKPNTSEGQYGKATLSHEMRKRTP